MEQLQVIHDGYHAVERRTTRQPKRKTLTGYGKDMPTDTQVFFEGRWRRVYATCYSNAAACHINYNGGKCIVL